MMDVLNRKIATVTEADDFIIGDQLISQMSVIACHLRQRI
jgi:hypothetical protein